MPFNKKSGYYMLDIMQIQEILPHRYPMLLVDRITDMELKQSIKGFKNISISEPAFQGHFPGHPIYPGVLILEGMAQCGGVLALKSSDLSDEEMKNKVIYFMSIDKAKFRNPVRPGDRLDYELEVVRMKSSLMTLIGKAYVDGKLTAEAELKAMIVDK
jgi:3-hydroxyacyl-[acyl-carrier-protein] dehydratase